MMRSLFRRRIVLLAADEMPSKHIAATLDTNQDRVWL
jgi:hypothetical protein